MTTEQPTMTASARPENVRTGFDYWHPKKSIEAILAEAESAIIDLRGCSRINARTYLSGAIRDADAKYYQP